MLRQSCRLLLNLFSSNSLTICVIPENKAMGLKEKGKQLRSLFQMSKCLLPKIHPGISPALKQPTCTEVHFLHPSQPEWCNSHPSLAPADPQGSDPAVTCSVPQPLAAHSAGEHFEQHKPYQPALAVPCATIYFLSVVHNNRFSSFFS